MLHNPFSSTKRDYQSSYLSASSPYLDPTPKPIQKPIGLVSFHQNPLTSSGLSSSSLDSPMITKSPYYSWNRERSRINSSQIYERPYLQNPFYRSSLLYKDQLSQKAYSNSYHTIKQARDYNQFGNAMMGFADRLNKEKIQRQNNEMGGALKNYGLYMKKEKQVRQTGSALKDYALHLKKQKQIKETGDALKDYAVFLKKQKELQETGSALKNYAMEIKKNKQIKEAEEALKNYAVHLKKQKETKQMGDALKNFAMYLKNQKQVDNIGNALEDYAMKIKNERQVNNLGDAMKNYGMHLKQQNQNYQMGNAVNSYARHLQKQKELKQTGEDMIKYGSYLSKKKQQNNKQFSSAITNYGIHQKQQLEKTRNTQKYASNIKQYGSNLYKEQKQQKEKRERQAMKNKETNTMSILGNIFGAGSKDVRENPQIGKKKISKADHSDSDEDIKNINKMLLQQQAPSFRKNSSGYPQSLDNRGKKYYKIQLAAQD